MKLYSVIAVVLVTMCACTPLSKPARPTPSADMTSYWEDDFSDPTSGWETNHTKGYLNGAYAITADGELVQATARHKHTKFNSVAIDVDVTRVENSGSYGVACRVQQGRGYYFLLNPENEKYAIIKRGPDGYTPLSDWQTSQVVRPTENHIRAVCGGSHLALFVNDQHLAVVEDSGFVSGSIALIASGSGMKARFDNVFVQYIPSEKFQEEEKAER